MAVQTLTYVEPSYVLAGQTYGPYTHTVDFDWLNPTSVTTPFDFGIPIDVSRVFADNPTTTRQASQPTARVKISLVSSNVPGVVFTDNSSFMHSSTTHIHTISNIAGGTTAEGTFSFTLKAEIAVQELYSVGGTQKTFHTFTDSV